jgi:hypothetical protein
MKTRANKGGEIGANGEFYKGGRFINTIAENAKKEGSKPRKPRKVQIAPYVWVVSDAAPLFGMVGTVAGYIDRSNPALGIKPDAAGVAYYGDDYHGRTVAEQCDRYNAGERWA